MSGAGLPCALRATSTSVYVRLHGPDGAHRYAGSYLDADLYWSADRIREWQRQHWRPRLFQQRRVRARRDQRMSAAHPNGLIDRTGQDRSGVWRLGYVLVVAVLCWPGLARAGEFLKASRMFRLDGRQ